MPGLSATVSTTTPRPVRREAGHAVRRPRAVPSVERAPSRAARLGPLLWLLVAFGSAGAHAGLFEWAVRTGLAHRTVPPPKQTLEVAVVRRAPPPPEPPPEPPKAPEPPATKKVLKVEASPPRPVPPPAAESPAPPPPNTEAPKPTPAVPLAGISLSSTSSAGAFAMNVGNTAYGEVSRTAPRPEDVKPYKAERYVPPHQLPESPAFLDNVSPAEMEKFYPPNARRDEVEDEVVVKLVVDDDGSVVDVKVVRWQHRDYPFDDAARRLARLYRFRPAKVDGKAVATEVTFTIRWELPY
jgi:protein TonB